MIKLLHPIWPVLFGAVFLIAFPAAQSVASNQTLPNLVEIQNGLISIPEGVYSRTEILDAISQLYGVEILVIGKLDSTQSVRVNFKKAKLEAVLQSLLKGKGFAIIRKDRHTDHAAKPRVRYLQNGSSAGLGQSKAEDPAASHSGSVDYVTDSAVLEATEQGILSQMENLEKRIQNGQSDREYEIWSSVRGEQFAVHDSERLAQKQQELESVRSGN
jgi:hypothetical protein